MIPFHYFSLILFLFTTQFITPIVTSTTTMPEKRNFSAFSLSSNQLLQQSPLMGASSNSKKLRRLPHVFSKVLELPFDSDADVVVEERHDCFKFTVEDGDNGVVGNSGVKAHVVEVHPGITKVVIRRRENLSLPIVDELELDVWRFRLPSSARPELATAVYARGKLLVTVPKSGWGEMDRRGGDYKGGFKGNMGNLIVVQ